MQGTTARNAIIKLPVSVRRPVEAALKQMRKEEKARQFGRGWMKSRQTFPWASGTRWTCLTTWMRSARAPSSGSGKIAKELAEEYA